MPTIRQLYRGVDMPSIGAGFPGFEDQAGKYVSTRAAIIEAAYRRVLTILGEVWWHPTYGTNFWRVLTMNSSQVAFDFMRAQIAIGLDRESHRLELVGVEFSYLNRDPVDILCVVTIQPVGSSAVEILEITINEGGVQI